jgi:hypothetical protein
MLSLFKMAPKCNTRVLSSVLRCKKAVMCLAKNIPVLGKLCTSMSYSIVEFSANESIIYI